MEPFISSAQKTTPSVVLNPENNTFEIKGSSYPEDASEFYIPVIEWLNKFANISYPKEIDFIIDLDYYNTSSEKYILEILKILRKIRENGTNIKVKWFYSEDDWDTKEIGKEFEVTLGIPFDFVAKEREEYDEIDNYF